MLTNRVFFHSFLHYFPINKRIFDAFIYITLTLCHKQPQNHHRWDKFKEELVFVTKIHLHLKYIY